MATAIAHHILFARDQKTAARARGAQKAKVHEVSPSSKLVGLIPVVVDWHTKVKLLDVSSSHFLSLLTYYFTSFKTSHLEVLFFHHSQGDLERSMNLGTS